MSERRGHWMSDHFWPPSAPTAGPLLPHPNRNRASRPQGFSFSRGTVHAVEREVTANMAQRKCPPLVHCS